MLYTAHTRLTGLCALFLIPGVTLMSVSPDHMHAKNQGVDAYFLGSILWYLVYVIMEDTPEANCSVLSDELIRAARLSSTRMFTCLTLGNLLV